MLAKQHPANKKKAPPGYQALSYRLDQKKSFVYVAMLTKIGNTWLIANVRIQLMAPDTERALPLTFSATV